MLIVGATRQQIIDALHKVNARFGNNITFRRLEWAGRTRDGRDKYDVLLRVKDTSGPGARRSPAGKRMIYACWHTHGCFFDALGELPQRVDIKAEGRWFRAGDAWVDWNKGSLLAPVMYSEMCDCGVW